MVKVKRYAASIHYPVPRKEKVWTVATRAGPHPSNESIPLLLVLRNVLRRGDTRAEIKKILNAGEVLVDGVARKDTRYICGMMDVISIPKTGESFRVLPKSGKLAIFPIEKKEAGTKLCRIIGKTSIKGGHVQLNLHDGRNILVRVKNTKSPKEAAEFKPGDTLVINVPTQKILDRLPLEVGAKVIVAHGKHAGVVGKLKKLVVMKGREPNKVNIDVDGKELITLAEYAFVIGREEPRIALPK